MKLRAYPEYRESGVAWLGRVPAGWPCVRAKNLLAESQLPVRPNDEIVTCFRDGQVTLRSLRRSRGYMMALLETGYQGVRKGQLVVHSMDAFAGAIGVSESDGKCTPEYIVCNPMDGAVAPDFYALLLRVMAQRDYIRVVCPAVRERAPRLRYAALAEMPLPVPPISEQRIIARFLKSMQINAARLVRAKRRLIELLNEQKRSTIDQMLLRGRVAGERVKPSGIAWLGDIVHSFTLRRFKSVTRINVGQVDPSAPEFRSMILIAPNHIEKGTGRVLLEESAAHQGAHSGKYFARKGQVLYSKIRPALRKAAIAPRDCLCSADMYALSPLAAELRPEYLVLLMLSRPFTKFAVDCSMRVAMPKVNREALGEAWLWYPRIHEQDEILRVLTDTLRPLDAAIGGAHREISLLHEYRTRLISDVVTGKLDVRNVPLPAIDDTPDLALTPDDADEPDPSADDLDPVPEEAEA